jgi:hypothetical protein
MGARANGELLPAVTLDGHDVRRLLRACWDAHAACDPAERKRRLVLGLCDLLGAYAGMTHVALLDPDTGRREVVSVVRAATGKDALPPAPWHDSPGSETLLGAPRNGHWVQTSVDLQANPTLVASTTLLRREGSAPASAQAVAVLRLAHAESARLYAGDRPLASPRVRGLPGVRRHVLQYLLAGESEADVAAWLGVGVKAVRREAQAAYRELGAADREALLARWSAEA